MLKSIFKALVLLAFCAGAALGQIVNPTFTGTVTFNQSVTAGSAILPPALLGSGVPSSLLFLRGDGVWAAVAGAQIPNLSGHSGQYLTNNGTTTSWAALTGSTGLDTIGSTKGSVLFRDTSAWNVLLPGSVNTVLTSGGTGVNPSYTAVVNSATGTASQILINGDTSAHTGALTFSLPSTITFTAITATTFNGNTLMPGTFTLIGGAGKTFTFNNSLTFAGTDGTVITLPTTSATLARIDAANTFTGTQTVTAALFAGTLNGNTFTIGTYTLTGAAAKVLTFNNTLTFGGVDGTLMTFPGTSATIARTDAANTFTGHQTIEGVTSTGATGTGLLVFATSPVLTTPTIGAAVATTVAYNGGQVQSFPFNYSTTSQAPVATTRTYLTGSTITVPAGKLQIGTVLHWWFNMTKTAAGSATSTIDVAIGTAGTTSDTAVVSFTKPAGTAAGDEAWCEVVVVIRGPLSASCVASGEFKMGHNLAATGHAQIPVVVVNTISGSFDATTAGLKVGLCLTSGASDAITIQQVVAEARNL